MDAPSLPWLRPPGLGPGPTPARKAEEPGFRGSSFRPARGSPAQLPASSAHVHAASGGGGEMGKVRGLRSRVHQAAVRLAGEAAGPAPQLLEPAFPRVSAGGAGAKDPTGAGIFSGTHIDPSALVQTLELDTRSVACTRRGVDPKTILPKKEKLRLRRERWLQKIEAIKQMVREQQAARKRRATAVVGDLQPLRDALPDLQQLEAGAGAPRSRSRPSRPRPTELSRMSAAQRQQLLEEERKRFRELLASPEYRACPLLAIQEQLHSQAL